jgi:hypothetical protein
MDTELVATKNTLNLVFADNRKTGCSSYKNILKIINEKNRLPLRVFIQPSPTDMAKSQDEFMGMVIPIINRLRNVGRKFNLVVRSNVDSTLNPMQYSITLYRAKQL